MADDNIERRAKKAKLAEVAPGKGVQFHCDYCRCDITNIVRIKCAVCPNFDLCVECFARGVEVTGAVNHRNDHAYSVMEHATEPIFDAKWGADEELLLLEAIEMSGFGNWSEVAEHVGSKSAADCEHHYIVTYLGTSDSLPLCELDNLKSIKDDSVESVPHASPADTDDIIMSDLSSTSSSSSTFSSSSSTPSYSPSSSTSTLTSSTSISTSVSSVSYAASASAAASSDASPSSTSFASTASLVSPASVATAAVAATTSSSAAAAAAVAVPYGTGNQVGYLPHRNDFEIEWENDAELVLADMEFRAEDTQTERDLKVRMLQIYCSKLDGREERKRFILERGLLFPKDKKRSKEEKEIHQNLKAFARFHSQEEHEAFLKGLLNEQRLRKRIEQLQSYRQLGIRTLADAEKYEIEKKKRAAQESQRKSRDVYDQNAKTASTSRGRVLADEAIFVPETLKLSKSRGKPLGYLPLDVSGLDGVDLLSAEEQKLCSEIRLIPRHYLIVKEALVNESLRRGFLRRGQARQLVRIDVDRTEKIFNFTVRAGWVNGIDDEES